MCWFHILESSETTCSLLFELFADMCYTSRMGKSFDSQRGWTQSDNGTATSHRTSQPSRYQYQPPERANTDQASRQFLRTYDFEVIRCDDKTGDILETKEAVILAYNDNEFLAYVAREYPERDGWGVGDYDHM